MEPKIKIFLLKLKEEDHLRIKTHATARGLTMKKWIINALAAAIRKEIAEDFKT